MDEQSGVKQQQIIAGGLIAGSAAFLVIALVIRSSEPWAQPWYGEMLAPIGALVTFGSVSASYVVGQILAAAVRKAESDQLKALVTKRMLVMLAVIEGSVMLNAVALIVEHSILSMACGFAGLVIMALQFPTEGRYQSLIGELEDQPQRRMPE